MPKQTTQWMRQDGSMSSSRTDAHYATADQVLAIASKHCRTLPPGFILGIAERETARCLNEVDTDYDDAGQPRPLKTFGLTQCNQGEQARADRLRPDLGIDPKGNLCDPEINLRVAVALFEDMLATLGKLAPAASLEDLLGYLCWGHNAGMHQPETSIAAHGCDWAELVRRNRAEDPQGVKYVSARLVPYATHILGCAATYPVASRDQSAAV